MKSKLIAACVSALLVALVSSSCAKSETERKAAAGGASSNNSNAVAQSALREPKAEHAGTTDEHGHDHSKDAGRVPAFQIDPVSLKNLKPTLDPASFTGKTREAYRVVKEIPETIAQLPCYCYCDEGFGHKSLHSCFVDDHASHCAVCVDEALAAYNMQKGQNLKPAEIRERVIAQFSKL